MKKHALWGRNFTGITQINLISAEVIALPLYLPSVAANLLLFWWNSDVCRFHGSPDLMIKGHFITVWEAQICYEKWRITTWGQNRSVRMSSLNKPKTISSQCLQSSCKEVGPRHAQVSPPSERTNRERRGQEFQFGCCQQKLCDGTFVVWLPHFMMFLFIFLFPECSSLFVSQIDSEAEGVWCWRVS